MSVTLNRLVRKVKTIDKHHQKYKLLMKYDGEVMGEYDMSSGERTRDMKTAEEWIRGNMVFLITLAGRDETKVEVELVKVK